jgi:hypothetical protein
MGTRSTPRTPQHSALHSRDGREIPNVVWAALCRCSPGRHMRPSLHLPRKARRRGNLARALGPGGGRTPRASSAGPSRTYETSELGARRSLGHVLDDQDGRLVLGPGDDADNAQRPIPSERDRVASPLVRHGALDRRRRKAPGGYRGSAGLLVVAAACVRFLRVNRALRKRRLSSL